MKFGELDTMGSFRNPIGHDIFDSRPQVADLHQNGVPLAMGTIPVGTGIGTLNAAAARNMAAIGAVVSDKLVANQWHLGFLGDLATVWKDSTGKGVSFGVYDSGVDTRLSAFKGGYDASREVRIDGKLFKGDYRPLAGSHGTAVAGLIGARADGKDTVGVAYDSKLTSVNIFDPVSGGGTDQGIYINGADSTKFYKAMANGNKFDVTNHSWGTSRASHDLDENRLIEGSFAYNTVKAVTFAADTGRGGLGTIALKAAGNNGVNTGANYLLSGIDAGADSVSSDRHWSLVGAFREVDGNASAYSNRGPSLLISAPSNDYAVLGGTGIWTTDPKGRDGENLTSDPGGARDYTDDFGGTSAATPIAAGVVGLMLDANPELGWRDVKDILAASAVMPVAFDTKPTSLTVGTAGGATRYNLNEDVFKLTGDGAQSVINGGGYHFSTDYGYGAINAFAATRMAEVWNLFGDAKTSANEAVVQAGRSFNTKLTDAWQDANYNTAYKGTTFRINVTGDVDIEHLDLKLSYASDNTYVSTSTDFVVTLTSPDGTRYTTSTLALEGAFGEGGTIGTEVYGFAGFRGENSKGIWSVSIADTVIGGQISIKKVAFDIYGAERSVDNVYHYTDEFATMLAIRGEKGRGVVEDKNGGTDWLDFSSVTAFVSVDMNAGGSVLFSGDRVATIGTGSQIENIVTGDASDYVVGNAADNHILGMRGSDFLLGGDGNDFLVGGMGGDTLTGDAGQDVFYFDTKQDVGRDTITDFSKDDLIAVTERFDTNGVIALQNVNGNGLLRFDNLQFGESVVFNGLGATKLYLVGERQGVFYYGTSSGNKLVNAIALGDGPLDATPGYAVNTHTTPTVNASTFVPSAPQPPKINSSTRTDQETSGAGKSGMSPFGQTMPDPMMEGMFLRKYALPSHSDYNLF